MTAPASRDEATTADPAADAVIAANLLAIDPAGLGGILVRSLPGPVRDKWLKYFEKRFPADTPMCRVPSHVSDDRLLGGLDLAATLKAGQPLMEKGLLAMADGGLLMLAMAERLPAATAASIAGVMDRGEVHLERDGFATTEASRFAVVAFDESLEDEDRPSAALRERLAFEIDLSSLSHRDWPTSELAPPDLDRAREALSAVTVEDSLFEAMAATAAALGIPSLRAPLFAVRAAVAAAALAGRSSIEEEDAACAVRLTLAHRAERLPAMPEDEAETEENPPEPPDDLPNDEGDETPRSDQPLEDRLLAAALAALPPGLLASLRQTGARGAAPGRAAASKKSGRRGRPAGMRPGRPRDGQRLSLLDTLRAAAPWQPIRRRQRPDLSPSRLQIRPDDFRLIRRKDRQRMTTIFVVDASGSSALERLAEAKGAVELLLAECYTRRDQVALIAFRREGAELLLPPTRSLVRAKRSLAALPGGGGTPLAAGIDAALQLADAARRRGETPLPVFLTDGRANIARDGTPGRGQAREDAQVAARHLAASGIEALVIDISARPGAEAAALAEALEARYLPLPKADAKTLSSMVASAGTR